MTIANILKQSSSADKRKPQIIFQAIEGMDILYLGGWRDNNSALQKTIESATGLSIPAKIFMSATNDNFTLLPVGIEKYRLLSSAGSMPKKLLQLPAEVGVSVLVSDSYELLQISGKGVEEFLRLLFTIDTSADVFLKGHVAMTAYHHASVTLHRSAADSYILHLPSGTAESLTETILQTACQFPFTIR